MNKLIWIFALISAASCNQLQILNAPKSVEFKGTSELAGDVLADVLAATLGYSVGQNIEWDGLTLSDPFHLASSVVTVLVEGDEISVKGAKSFNLVGSSDFDQTLQTKVHEHSHQALEIDLTDNFGAPVNGFHGDLISAAEEQDIHFLKPKSNKYDQQVLNQIAQVNGLAKAFDEQKDLPTAVIVKITFKYLKEQHQTDSSAIQEAKKLMGDAIDRLNKAVQKAYSGEAVFAVVSLEQSHSRVRRQAEKQETDHNLAPVYDPNYPVIFNIILWFSIILIFTLLAISLAIAGMEDKDSIIYRMTSTRMKKEN